MRIRGLVVLLGMSLALPAVEAVAYEDPGESVSEYEASIAESAEQNRAFVDDEGDATVQCVITPFDPVDDGWSGAGYGNSATDYASFEASCIGVDSSVNDFGLTAEYWFEARMRPGLEGWDQTSPTFSCSSSAYPIGERAHITVTAPPASNTWFCPFEWSYDEEDPSVGRPHRLHVVLTTTTDVRQEGVSLPWPLLSSSLACTPLTCSE